MSDKKLISIVVPAYNEQDNIEPAYEAVCETFSRLPEYDFEIVFCDNHSTDLTFQHLSILARRDPRVRVVRYSRNFGFNRSVLTGYRLARGNAAVQLDCDLQDPPDLIIDMIALWNRGHDVVVGVRRSRPESWWLQAARRAFYIILHRMSDDNIVIDGGDFRLIDRAILDGLHRINDADPYVRALTSLLARNQATIAYDRRSREVGSSKYPVRRLIAFAVSGMVAHSVVPLRFASIFGLSVAMLSLLLGSFYIILKLFGLAEDAQGFTTLSVLILLGISVNAIFLGIIGEYLGRIYNQMRWRPTAVIEATLNVSNGPVGTHSPNFDPALVSPNAISPRGDGNLTQVDNA